MQAIEAELTIKHDGKAMEWTVTVKGKDAITQKCEIGGADVCVEADKSVEQLPQKQTYKFDDKGQIVVDIQLNTESKDTKGPWNEKFAETRVWELNGDSLTCVVTNTANKK